MRQATNRTPAPTPVIHTYQEINIGKYVEVRHFDIVYPKEPIKLLSKKINISINRNCAKSRPLLWVKVHNGKKWVSPCLTGLFSTKYKNIYVGDINSRKHLILCEIRKNVLTTYVFVNYHTTDLRNVMHFLKRA